MSVDIVDLSLRGHAKIMYIYKSYVLVNCVNGGGHFDIWGLWGTSEATLKWRPVELHFLVSFIVSKLSTNSTFNS